MTAYGNAGKHLPFRTLADAAAPMLAALEAAMARREQAEREELDRMERRLKERELGR